MKDITTTSEQALAELLDAPAKRQMGRQPRAMRASDMQEVMVRDPETVEDYENMVKQAEKHELPTEVDHHMNHGQQAYMLSDDMDPFGADDRHDECLESAGALRVEDLFNNNWI